MRHVIPRDEVQRAAVLSRDGLYRYALRRVWDPARPAVLFIGLNPSTADHRIDDPTIRRCVRFARDWGFGQLLVGNLFAFRTASTRVLRRVDVPVGADNDVWLRRLVGEARVVVAAWGNFGRWLGRDRAVVELLGSMQCLGVTRFGQPRHPLYLRASSGLRDFDARSVSGSWRGGG